MASTTDRLILDGRGLTPARVAEIARRARPVAIDAGARERMARARAVVERRLAEGAPVYGLTTGLGARVGHRLPAEALAEFSHLTVRGRSNAVGPRMPREAVRATLAARLNGLLVGASGAAPEAAEALAALLNAGLHPVMPGLGSIGAGDLCLLAHVGLALIGEGEIESGGAVLSAAEALGRAGLAPLALGPKDGLALINASSVSAGLAALALVDARDALDLAGAAAALSMEGFRANLSPLDPRALALRPQPGQAEAAARIRTLLEGGDLTRPGAARRLQDPLSLRCVAQVHGALAAAAGFAEAALEPELNGEACNPAVLADDGEILSHGNFHTPLLAIALDTLTRAVAQAAQLSALRTAKLLSERFSGLPANLSPHAPTHSGLAPLLKTAEALLAEIDHAATPAPAGPSLSADGVEDHMTHAPLAARKTGEAVRAMRLVLAIELIAAAQAVELRGGARLGWGTARTVEAVRKLVPPLGEDRAHGAEVERLEAELLANRRLLEVLATGT